MSTLEEEEEKIVITESTPLLSDETFKKQFSRAVDDTASTSSDIPASSEAKEVKFSVQERSDNFCRQTFLGIIVAMPNLPTGMSTGFSAVALDQLNLGDINSSWFASVAAIAVLLGSLLIGPLIDHYGRRPSLLLINVISCLGWLLLSIPSENPTMLKLISGRLLTGFAGGLACFAPAVYIAECLCVDSVKRRSCFVAWPIVSLSAGIFFVYLTGAFMPYFTVAGVAALISIISFVLIAIFIPESPAWLMLKGRRGDAEWAQKQLNLSTSTPLRAVENRKNLTSIILYENCRELRKPEVFKPIVLMILFFFFQQFSGVYVIMAYTVDIVRESGIIILNPYTVTLVAGGIILLITILASLIFPKAGIRITAIISGVGTTVTLFFLAVLVHLRSLLISRQIWYLINWLPLSAILINIASSSLGFLILPWSMLSEIFPLNVKGLAASISTSFGFMFSFLIVELFPFMLRKMGISGIYLFFGVISLLGTIYVILFLPETRGKTLEEINEEFSQNRGASA